MAEERAFDFTDFTDDPDGSDNRPVLQHTPVYIELGSGKTLERWHAVRWERDTFPRQGVYPMYNKVIVMGTVGDRGVTVRPQHEGTMQASFLLKLTETNEAGRVFTSYQSVEVYGKALATAESLHPGDVVLVDGKLRRRRVGEGWDTCVVALSLQRVQAAALAEEG
jgi:hypothetical protein